MPLSGSHGKEKKNHFANKMLPVAQQKASSEAESQPCPCRSSCSWIFPTAESCLLPGQGANHPKMPPKGCPRAALRPRPCSAAVQGEHGATVLQCWGWPRLKGRQQPWLGRVGPPQQGGITLNPLGFATVAHPFGNQGFCLMRCPAITGDSSPSPP